MSEWCIHQSLNLLESHDYCPLISVSIYILKAAYLMKPRQEVLVVCVPVEVDPIVGLYMRSGCLDIPPSTDPAVKAEQGRVAALTSTAVTHLQLARIPVQPLSGPDHALSTGSPVFLNSQKLFCPGTATNQKHTTKLRVFFSFLFSSTNEISSPLFYAS